MTSFENPLCAVLQYIAAFNHEDAAAMVALCDNPMQILDGMPPHVWQGPTAAADWWHDVTVEGARLGAGEYRISFGEPRHVDINGDHAYVVLPASMTLRLKGTAVRQTGSVYTVALRRTGGRWLLTAWSWAKGE